MSFECPVWPPEWPEIEAAAVQAIRNGHWGRYHSPLCQTLESRLCDDFSVTAARLCCSGTAALEIGLRVAQIGPGDEVILAAYDFPGNFRSIELVGATPVLVDVCGPTIDRDSKLSAPVLDPSMLDSAASDRVKALVVSHLHGSIADVQSLREYCDRRGWILMEDVCQAIGAQRDGRTLGSFGQIAMLSFGGSKLVSAGSGGALLLNDARMAARIGALVDRPGDTFPLSPLQAAVIAPQFDRLLDLNRMRAETARFLTDHVIPNLEGWEIVAAESGSTETPAHYKYAWMAASSEDRARVIQAGTEIGLPMGEGFRSMSGCSARRCRKPVETPWSDRFGERLVLLDHRALMIGSDRYQELAAAMVEVHQRSRA
ncbi:MAG: DegT/DnrJ/EryC1/StrS family aminotransferase [Rubripirellula sp.]